MSSIMFFASSLLHENGKGIVLHENGKGIVGLLIHRSEWSACMAGIVIAIMGFLVTPHDGICLWLPLPTITYINQSPLISLAYEGNKGL